MTYTSETILRLLTDAAAASKPCPTDDTLARAAGCAKSRASVVILQFRTGGYIRIEKPDRNKRVIRIVTTGQATAPTAQKFTGGGWNRKPNKPKAAPVTVEPRRVVMVVPPMPRARLPAAVREPSSIPAPSLEQLMGGHAKVARTATA